MSREEIDRIASIWKDVRIRLNMHKDYPDLALAIENLVDSDKMFAGGGDGTFDERDLDNE